jgi:hypothetical protein
MFNACAACPPWRAKLSEFGVKRWTFNLVFFSFRLLSCDYLNLVQRTASIRCSALGVQRSALERLIANAFGVRWFFPFNRADSRLPSLALLIKV